MRYSGILLLGPTGSGKTPLGDYLEEKGMGGRLCRHFDFGAQLRYAVTEGGAACGLNAREISFLKGVLEEGRLLEDRHFPIAARILRRFLRSFSRKDTTVVLNGLPRHRGQADKVADLVKVERIILLECCASDVLYRVRENTGGDRTLRVDDELPLVEKKLRIYAERTLPLLDYYREAGVDIRIVQVGRQTGPGEVYAQWQSEQDGLSV